MTAHDVFIVAAKRTPVGKAPRGMFKTVRPDDLLVHAIKACLAECPTADPAEIGDFIVGCAMPEADQGMNIARIAGLLAGLPESVPGYTINRFCSSGIQAISLAADKIRLGEAEMMLAGGVESMSKVPLGGFSPSYNPKIFNDENVAIAYGMGITAENVANDFDISRRQQDEFAYESHKRAINARKAGHFKDEIAPYSVTLKSPNEGNTALAEQTILCEHDEGPREDTSLEKLGKLRSVFNAKGSVTAGNSSQMSDGAAVLLLASERAVKHHNLTPLARFVGFSVAGVPPRIMGIGPSEAIPKALDLTGVKMHQLDWIELNEAFAAQALAVIKTLKLDPAKVNPYGGAIALGHPLGATGAIKATTVVHALQRKRLKYGMVTMCIGTGMGAAGILERV